MADQMFALNTRLRIDDVAKRVYVQMTYPGDVGDVVLFEQDVTARLTAEDKRRLLRSTGQTL